MTRARGDKGAIWIDPDRAVHDAVMGALAVR